jgi:chitodextrinase
MHRLAGAIGTGAVALGLAIAFGAPPAHAVSTPTSVTVTWTAPGDDGDIGTAALYDLRYATAPIDAGNFAQAFAVTGEPAPQPAGSTQSMLVTGLSPATAYWFAVRTRDESGNWSAISNIVSWTTPSASDAIRPAPLQVALAGTTASSVTLSATTA